MTPDPCSYFDELRVRLAFLAEVADGFEYDTALRVGKFVTQRKESFRGLVDLVVDEAAV